ncbi:hypothetical protein [Streptococcus sobrinus]|uniref:Uncharacterized protein n=1 Tax=Streptococcus sobrinus TaxID=1310 RepID=A0ABM6W7U8_9STRE|nr:hypothetical protein [Streptococcus sobrinus]AWN21461.1 hypothetical protein DK182_09055 [Streptococcus sobrinus]EMP72487.1 hypothetical protein D823_02926 [Streptococcus sobrinus DSM 20742 = ATCC 33478]SQG14280.1 Uncharacterised protein [Streptococcus sobrinus]
MSDALIEKPKSRIDIWSILYRTTKTTVALWAVTFFCLTLYFVLFIPSTIESKNIYYISHTDVQNHKIYLSKSTDNAARRFVAKRFIIDYPSEKMISGVSIGDFRKIYGPVISIDREVDFVSYTPQKGLKFLSNNEAKKIHFSDKDPVDWAIKQIKLWMILMTAGLIFLLRLGSATFKKKGRDDNKYQGVPVDQEVEESIILSDEEENNDKAFY